MRVFLTGATGFIGGEVARRLCGRGDEVVALVRNPAKATALRELGCELVRGDVSERAAITAGLAGADAAIHNAAIYEVGIPASARPAMYETNVRGTENVLGAALEAGTPKVVYVSTVAAFGNTRGEVVDEAHEHRGDYCSYYEETKHLAHQAVRRLIEQGLPCVIVQPGGVYGPHDHSQLGNVMNQFLRWRLPLIPMAEMGHTAVHRDDVAQGILLALEHGTPGEAYVLGGELTTIGEMVATLARVTGRRPPIGRLPTVAIRLAGPVAPLIGRYVGLPPNVRELISSGAGVSYTAKHDKATRELGYAPRGLEQGLRDMLAAEGRPAKR